MDYLNSIISAAVCTAMVKYAFTRRRDGTRRIIFAVGAAIVVPAIVGVVVALQTASPSDVGDLRLPIVMPALLLVAGASWVYGMGWWRFAKRVGDHPYCRKCGFDLFGKPETSTRCGECGADLAAKKSVVIGIRTRRYRILAISLFAFFLGVLIGGKPAYEWVQDVDWQARKPMWWLIRELDGTNAQIAANEIGRRCNQSQLTTSQVQALTHYLINLPAGNKNVSLLYIPGTWMNDHDDLDESDARKIVKSFATLCWIRPVPIASRGMPIPFQAITYSDTFLIKGNLSKTSATIHLRLANVDLPTPTQEDARGMRTVDPGLLWSQIPDGKTQLSIQADGVAYFRSHGKEYTEPFSVKAVMPISVATGAASQAPTTRPTVADLASTWTATFGNPYNETSRGLKIDSTFGPSRVFAHVILIDSIGRHDIGLLDGRLNTYKEFTANSDFRKPVGPARIELVPAPEASRNNWDMSPILDQTITINQVTVE